MVYIVGLGPGHKDYMLKKAIDILKDSDFIIGFKRAIQSLDFLSNEKIKVSKLKEILDFIKINNNKKVCIVASGDPLFYGISNYIKKNYNEKLEIIPGISSYQYMMSKINISWQESYLGSLHGRDEEFIKKVKQYNKSIWLTDKINSPKNLCENLLKENINCTVIIGENLSYENEKISSGKPKELVFKEFSSLSIVLILNEVLN